MVKRTNTYIVLCLIVITSLGSQVYRPTISSKERKWMTTHLKDSRSQFLKSVKDLSDPQLNFKPDKGAWSIKECIMHIAATENELWLLARKTMKGTPNPEEKNNILVKDEYLLKGMADHNQKEQAPEQLQPAKATWETTEAAIDAFKENRGEVIKFIKTTTTDVRNYVAEAPFGKADVYQILIVISAHSARHTKQIEEIKGHPAFPKD